MLTVVIATSNNRTNWLLNRSLLSVYRQKRVNPKKIKVSIVDDNKDPTEFFRLQKGIANLRSKMGLGYQDFMTTCMRNERTRFMSGTGAWNTGIYKAYREDPLGWLAILDDDDAYLDDYLSVNLAKRGGETQAIFQQIVWLNEDGSRMELRFSRSDLSPVAFFKGNPGIQGSNMFFKTAALIEIAAFDEKLPNTTDRDLMIRFLKRYNKLDAAIEIIPRIGVLHYNHNKYKVNTDLKKKHEGLNIFYEKYRAEFSNQAYQDSLKRAKKFFNYEPK